MARVRAENAPGSINEASIIIMVSVSTLIIKYSAGSEIILDFQHAFSINYIL